MLVSKGRNPYTSLLMVLIATMCTSCSIHGSLQGLYSYYNKTKAQSPDLLIHPGDDMSIDEIRNGDTAKVYIINGRQLKECLGKLDDAVVYLWSPKCRSKVCYPRIFYSRPATGKI